MGANVFEIDLAFPHLYELSEPPELPGSGVSGLSQYYYPPPKGRTERDGLWIRCRPRAGKDWVGVFGDEYGTPPAISKVLSTPDPDRVCVISGGRGYVVNSSKPTEWRTVPFFPITYATPLLELRFLLFANFSSIVAWNNDVIWQATVAVYDLTITSVTADQIKGHGYDPALGADDSFVVETSTGRVHESEIRRSFWHSRR